MPRKLRFLAPSIKLVVLDRLVQFLCFPAHGQGPQNSKNLDPLHEKRIRPEGHPNVETPRKELITKRLYMVEKAHRCALNADLWDLASHRKQIERLLPTESESESESEFLLGYSWHSSIVPCTL